jgi:hypothetical protein
MQIHHHGRLDAEPHSRLQNDYRFCRERATNGREGAAVCDEDTDTCAKLPYRRPAGEARCQQGSFAVPGVPRSLLPGM